MNIKQGLKKLLSQVSLLKKTVWNTTLELLRYGIERKVGVILRCKLVTHNKQMSTLPSVSLFQILSAMYYFISQILFELVHRWESYRKNKNGELTFETQKQKWLLFIGTWLQFSSISIFAKKINFKFHKVV